MSDIPQYKDSLKVAVLMGWEGSERKVSLQSGQSVSKALRVAGIEVIDCDIRPGSIGVIEDSTIDVFFLALHGQFGEDGQLQAILSSRKLIYTGSNPESSRCAFDKRASKKALVAAGIRVPTSIEFDGQTNRKQLQSELAYISDKFVGGLQEMSRRV